MCCPVLTFSPSRGRVDNKDMKRTNSIGWISMVAPSGCNSGTALVYRYSAESNSIRLAPVRTRPLREGTSLLWRLTTIGLSTDCIIPPRFVIATLCYPLCCLINTYGWFRISIALKFLLSLNSSDWPRDVGKKLLFLAAF